MQRVFIEYLQFWVVLNTAFTSIVHAQYVVQKPHVVEHYIIGERTLDTTQCLGIFDVTITKINNFLTFCLLCR